MKNFLYVTLIAVGVVIIFYIFFDAKPSGLILTLIGISIAYLLVKFIRDIFLIIDQRKNKK